MVFVTVHRSLRLRSIFVSRYDTWIYHHITGHIRTDENVIKTKLYSVQLKKFLTWISFTISFDNSPDEFIPKNRIAIRRIFFSLHSLLYNKLKISSEAPNSYVGVMSFSNSIVVTVQRYRFRSYLFMYSMKTQMHIHGGQQYEFESK